MYTKRPRIPHSCCEHGSHLATCWLVIHMVVQLHEMLASTTVLPAMYCSALHTVLLYYSGIQVVLPYSVQTWYRDLYVSHSCFMMITL